MKDIDIWRAANEYVRLYGDEALEMAAERIDELAEQGDTLGIMAWKLIFDAIKQLQETSSETVH